MCAALLNFSTRMWLRPHFLINIDRQFSILLHKNSVSGFGISVYQVTPLVLYVLHPFNVQISNSQTYQTLCQWDTATLFNIETGLHMVYKERTARILVSSPLPISIRIERIWSPYIFIHIHTNPHSLYLPDVPHHPISYIQCKPRTSSCSRLLDLFAQLCPFTMQIFSLMLLPWCFRWAVQKYFSQ